LVYVAFQYAAAAGWELDEALDRVHKSNLSKLVDGKPLKRQDGKVLKGPNYQPANLIDLV
jgi:predicted HAD superfamily Cof-like phosphohydrolase